MKGIKEAFIDAGEISQMLGIGMTKAYAIIKEYNAELEAKGYFTMRGKCPRKYFEQKIYGYEDYYNPDYEPQRNRSKVAEEMDYEVAVGASVISEQDEVDIPPETKTKGDVMNHYCLVGQYSDKIYTGVANENEVIFLELPEF